MKMLPIAALVLLLASRAVVTAEPDADALPSEVTLPGTEVRTIHSEIVGQDYRLLVALPLRRPTEPARKMPVLYLLDADMSFPLVRQVVLSLQSGREMPPVVIVGVGYPGGFREGLLRRTRDYTPTADAVFTRHAARWEGREAAEVTSGGAPAFLRFVREELKPYVEAHYPVDRGDATIFGVSFGGLFASYALLEAPDTFQRYVIGSPSLWWGGRALFSLEERFASRHQDLPARVFIGVGGRETTEHDDAALARLPEQQRRPMLEFQEAIGGGAQMLEVVRPFVERLAARAYPALDLVLEVFPEETHASVPPMTLSRGLRVVFETF